MSVDCDFCDFISFIDSLLRMKCTKGIKSNISKGKIMLKVAEELAKRQ
jgi:hypothetical protein